MTTQVRSVAVRLSLENANYIRGTQQAVTETNKAATQIERRVGQTSQRTVRDWDTMGRYGGRAALAIGAGFAVAESKIVSFDKTVSAASAATGAQGARLEQLRKAAIKAGKDTAFSATEAAQAIVEEGKAGISTANILNGGLSGALNLAAAGQIAVGEAAEYTATTLNQYELSGKQAVHVSDLLAAAAGKAQGEVGDMALALSYVGVPAHQAGVSLEETVGTIALLAKSGVIGERAGTSLRGMLASLTSPSQVAADKMKELRISVFDATGEFIGFDGVAQVLHDRLKGLTEQERLNALGKIFGNEQLQAANLLYDKGAAGVRKMTREVNDQGYAAETSAKKLDNLAGDWERFTGSLETAFIVGGSPVQDELRSLVSGADNLVDSFSGLPEEIQGGLVKVLALTAAVGATAYAVAKVRNIARDLRGGSRAGGAGGLGGAASALSPVPVFVTNMGVGGLSGVGGKGGTPLVLGKGAAAAGKAGAAAEAGGFLAKYGSKLAKAGNVAAIVALLGLSLSGKDKGFGSTATLAGFGSIGGPVGIATGATIGAGLDIANQGNSAKDVIQRARDAVASGDLKTAKKALADLNAEAHKLALGGSGQNFARFVTEVTGRRNEMEQLAGSLKDIVTYANADGLDVLLGTKKPQPKKQPPKGPVPTTPGKDLYANLSGPTGRPPKKDVAVPGMLKPRTVNLLEEFLNVVRPAPNASKVPVSTILALAGLSSGKQQAFKPSIGDKQSRKAIATMAVSLDLDPKRFNTKAKKAKATAEALSKLFVQPTADLNINPALAKLNRLKAELAATAGGFFGQVLTGGADSNPFTPGKAAGGLISGPGTGTSDSIPARLSNGEYVIPAAAVEHYGVGFFDAARSKRLAAYAMGGLVGARSVTVQGAHGDDNVHKSVDRFKKAIEASTKALDKERTKRQILLDQRSGVASSVRGNLRRDLFGTDPDGSQWLSAAARKKAGVGDVFSVLTGDIANASAFGKALKNLKGKGLDGNAFAEIAAKGTLQEAQGLASLSKAEIARYEVLFNRREKVTNRVGTFAGQAAYGKQIATQTEAINEMAKDLKALKRAAENSPEKIGDAVGKRVNRAAAPGRKP